MAITARILAENPTSEEFTEIRRHLITGTDAATILGLNKYSTPYELALTKKGLVPPRPMNEAMQLGKEVEPVILSAFATKMNLKVRPNRAIMGHPEIEWLGGTPDAFLADDSAGVELKLAGLHSAKDWGEPGTLDVPVAFFCQVQVYLAVTGLDLWYLVGMLGTKVQVHPIEKDWAVIHKIIEAAKEFRERYLLGDEMPEPGADDVSLVSSQFPLSQEGVIEETPELRALAEALAAGRAAEATGKRMVGDARAKLELAMGAMEKLKLSDGGITWRTSKPTTSINYEEIVVEAIDKLPAKYSAQIQKMIPKHTVTKPGSRAFRPYGALFEKE